MLFIILTGLSGALVGALIVWAFSRSARQRALGEKEVECARLAAALESEKKLREADRDNAEKAFAAASARCEKELAAAQERGEKALSDARTQYEKLVADMKESQKAVLESERKALALDGEKQLRAREESLKKEAEATMKTVAGTLEKDLRAMREAFESQKKAHTEESSAMKTKLDETVEHLRRQTEAIGGKADRLAEALRGDNKMQGNWGERMLGHIFDQEGLVEGRDYEREQYLRDSDGTLLVNEDTGHRMRTDYILHFPDNTDVVIDAKTNLDAYVDWYNATTDEEREEAAQRNLRAIRAQVDLLAKKRYKDYVKGGRKSLDYVIMYVSNYGALQLACSLEPALVNESFRKNVLITTEETLMPFLRMIHTAWVNVDQVRNQEKIVKAAQMMLDRVAEFCEANALVGKRLREAVEAHEKGSKKLLESGPSIVHAAREVVRLGVPSKKELPSPEN